MKVHHSERIGEFTQILTHFDKEPQSSIERLRSLRSQNREEFEDLAFDWLKSSGDVAGSRLIAGMIMITENRLRQLCDAVFFSNAEALSIVRHLSRPHKKLAYWLVDVGLPMNVDNGTAERVLCLVEAAASREQLDELMSPLMESSNGRVRSKAVLLKAKSGKCPRWAKEMLSDPDPRIGANAVEAMWDAGECAGILEFFREAANENNPRTAVNALVGLIRFGDQEAENTLQALAGNVSPDFRASSAWGMGESGLPVFLPCLQGMLDDLEPKVKLNAVRSMRRISMAMHRTQPIEKQSGKGADLIPVFA